MYTDGREWGLRVILSRSEKGGMACLSNHVVVVIFERNQPLTPLSETQNLPAPQQGGADSALINPVVFA